MFFFFIVMRIWESIYVYLKYIIRDNVWSEIKEDNFDSFENCVWGIYLRSRWYGVGCIGSFFLVLEVGDFIYSFICGGIELIY